MEHGISTDEQGIEEHQFELGVGAAVVSIVKSLPKVWKLRKEAHKLSKALPDYNGEVEVSFKELLVANSIQVDALAPFWDFEKSWRRL